MFFTSDIREDQAILHDQEATHVTKVLRKNVGDELIVIDGHGHRHTCVIAAQKRDRVETHIVHSIYRAIDKNLPELAFGLIKNTTRLEWMIEKVTELGVRKIIPLICTRSERDSIKKDRLEKIIISAVKQSLQWYIPELSAPIALSTYLDMPHSPGYIAHLSPAALMLSEQAERYRSAHLLIGPEGDFTDEEISDALGSGYTQVSLGSSRLRAETAAVAAVTMCRL